MLNPDFRDILSAFLEEKVEFLIVGAYALAAHGFPRATGDIDLWVRPTRENSAKVWGALEKFGAPMKGLDPEDFTKKDLVVQIGRAPRRIDIVTAITAVDFERAWSGRTAVEMEGMELFVLGKDDLLTNKKAVGRPQDIADAERLDALDRPDGGS